jgi:hypothetical protein
MGIGGWRQRIRKDVDLKRIWPQNMGMMRRGNLTAKLKEGTLPTLVVGKKVDGIVREKWC